MSAGLLRVTAGAVTFSPEVAVTSADIAVTRTVRLRRSA